MRLFFGNPVNPLTATAITFLCFFCVLFLLLLFPPIPTLFSRRFSGLKIIVVRSNVSLAMEMRVADKLPS